MGGGEHRVYSENNVKEGGWCTVPTKAVQAEIALTYEWSRGCFSCFSLTNEPTMFVILQYRSLWCEGIMLDCRIGIGSNIPMSKLSYKFMFLTVMKQLSCGKAWCHGINSSPKRAG